MAATLTIQNAFEVSVSRSSLYVQAFGRELFASFEAPKGAPMWELSRWELGQGWRLRVGPLAVDAGRA